MNIKEFTKKYTNKPLAAVEKAATKYAWTIRVNEKDGLPLILTRDFKTDRLNIVVSKGIVTEILGFG
jgi:hypothetical protein